MKRTLKKGYQFRRVFRTGAKFRGNSFRAYYRRNTLGFIRLGFSLSAKSGNAVQRNLMRRRIRELAGKVGLGADVVILPAGPLKEINYSQLKMEFQDLIAALEGTGNDA